jgi:hypothetical protein
MAFLGDVGYVRYLFLATLLLTRGLQATGFQKRWVVIQRGAKGRAEIAYYLTASSQACRGTIILEESMVSIERVQDFTSDALA